MPDCHDIACGECKVFMGTFKLAFLTTRGSLQGERSTRVARAEIIRTLDYDDQHFRERGPSHWFYVLRPFLEWFLDQHATHELHFYREGSGPWEPEEPGYLDWKEMAGPDFATSSEFYLPRNLIDDLQTTSWDSALALLQENYVVRIDDIQLYEYRQKFESLLRGCST